MLRFKLIGMILLVAQPILASATVTLEDVLTGVTTRIFPKLVFSEESLTSEYRKLKLRFHEDKLSDEDREYLEANQIRTNTPLVNVNVAYKNYCDFLIAFRAQCKFENEPQICPACSQSLGNEQSCIKVYDQVYHAACWNSAGLNRALAALELNDLVSFKSFLALLSGEAQEKAFLAYIEKCISNGDTRTAINSLCCYYSKSESWRFVNGVAFFETKLKSRQISQEESYGEITKIVKETPSNIFAKEAFEKAVDFFFRNFSVDELVSAAKLISADNFEHILVGLMLKYAELDDLTEPDFRKILTVLKLVKKEVANDFLQRGYRALAKRGHPAWAITVIDLLDDSRDYRFEYYCGAFKLAISGAHIEEVYRLIPKYARYFLKVRGDSEKLALERLKSIYSELRKKAAELKNDEISDWADGQVKRLNRT